MMTKTHPFHQFLAALNNKIVVLKEDCNPEHIQEYMEIETDSELADSEKNVLLNELKEAFSTEEKELVKLMFCFTAQCEVRRFEIIGFETTIVNNN